MPDAARPALEARMRDTPLLGVVGIEHGMRLAGFGLRTVADLDALVLGYREAELHARMGLNRRQAREVLGRLLCWTKKTFNRLLLETARA